MWGWFLWAGVVLMMFASMEKHAASDQPAKFMLIAGGMCIVSSVVMGIITMFLEAKERLERIRMGLPADNTPDDDDEEDEE